MDAATVLVPAKFTKRIFATLLLTGALIGSGVAQKDTEPTAALDFLIIKEDNGKPIRNAAVIMHPVSPHGKQGRGDLELKTDSEGKASFDGVPYGGLRVQILAAGFHTFGEDYEVTQPKMSFSIRLKRPQGQYSIYQDHPEEKKKDDKAPPPDPNAKPQ